MARSFGPFMIIEKVGSHAYKLQQLGDIAVSATFNMVDLSPYVEDTVEDPSDLRSNPSEEGEVDAGACPYGNSEDNQGHGSKNNRHWPTKFKHSSLFLVPEFTLFEGPFQR